MDTKLSESEQYLWDFIQSHILEIPSCSIIKLSEYANRFNGRLLFVPMKEKKGYGGFYCFQAFTKRKKIIPISILQRLIRWTKG